MVEQSSLCHETSAESRPWLERNGSLATYLTQEAIAPCHLACRQYNTCLSNDFHRGCKLVPYRWLLPWLQLLLCNSQVQTFVVLLLPDAQSFQNWCRSDCSICMHVGANCQGQQVSLTLTPILIQAVSAMHSPFQLKSVADSQLHSAQLHAWHTMTQGLL
jgi:hypothetical protein